MRRLICAALTAGASVACTGVTYESGEQVSLELTADRSTVGPGGEVTFSYDAVGSALVRITIDFGDGASTTVNTVGAQAASGRVAHAFATTGSFTVRGTVEDGVQGPATDELVVVVTAAQFAAVAGAGGSPP